MSGGVIVAAWVVGALALCETVLPRAFAALRKWRRGAKGEEAEKIGTRGSLDVAVEKQNGRGTASVQQQEAQSEAGDGQEARTEAGDRQEARTEAGDGQGTSEKARQLWDEARKMKHHAIPNFSRDSEYLKLVNAAAEAGCMEAMDKLGTYAFRRKAFVEAFYWKLLVRLGGGKTHEVGLKDIRIAWMACGCPMQHRNVYEGFGEEKGVFARAVLKIQCGIDVARARNRIRELVKAGNPHAIRFDGFRRPIV